MALRAGALRDRVTLMRKTMVPNPNGKGGLVPKWSEVATLWAQVIGLNGREAMIAQALQGVSAFKVVIRYRGDVGDTDQLRYQPPGAPKPLTLNVHSATDPDGRREQLLILADTASAENVPDGA